MWISADNEKIRYSGRIDWSVPKEPTWIFPCTSSEFKFTGNTLKIYVKNKNEYWQNYLGCILDNVQSCFCIKKDGETKIEVQVNENETGVHHVLFFKRQDSCHELTILGYEIEDGEKLLELPKKPDKRIEVYGDSVSAGEVSEAVDFVGKEDPEHEGGYSNSYYSYGWILARKLGAQIHDIAQGGIALMDGEGWYHEPEQIGMETVWNKVHYNTRLSGMSDWDFSKYIPQVVIVAVGQNDCHPKDYMKEDYCQPQARKWREHYMNFLRKLRSVYSEANIICCTTLLNHDESWDDAIAQVVKNMDDKKITQYVFKRNGMGTSGHLRIPEAYEMAEELEEYIGRLDGKVFSCIG